MPPTSNPNFNAEINPSFDNAQDHIKVFRRSDLPAIDAGYASDSSDESVVNTVGNVPVEWYSEYPHIGYDINGRKILKPAKGDELEEFLASMDDPKFLQTVFDDVEKKNVTLTRDQAEMMKRIMKNEFPDADFDPYQVNYYYLIFSLPSNGLLVMLKFIHWLMLWSQSQDLCLQRLKQKRL